MSNTNKNIVLNKLRFITDEMEKMDGVAAKHNFSNGGDREKLMKDEEVLALQMKLVNEYKENLDTYDKTKELTVYYEQDIQLLHLASQKWLVCQDVESNYEKENFLVTLDSFTSENSQFKIVPAFKYQRDGDTVIYNDDIVRIVRS